MPSYKVIERGFFGGKLYDPTGKRKVLHTEKPFPSKNKKEQVPSWLERIKDETASEKKKRQSLEKRDDELSKRKAKNDLDDINKASFLGDGEKADVVETL